MGKVFGLFNVLVCRSVCGPTCDGRCVMSWNDEMMAIEASKPANVKTLDQFMADQDKVWMEGQKMFAYFHEHARELYKADMSAMAWHFGAELKDETSKFNVGEVVVDIIGNRAIVAAIPTITFLDLIYEGYDVPQSMRAVFVTKLHHEPEVNGE